MILEAFTKPYCQMTALDGIIVALLIGVPFTAVIIIWSKRW